jgi:hypothetical protein
MRDLLRKLSHPLEVRSQARAAAQPTEAEITDAVRARLAELNPDVKLIGVTRNKKGELTANWAAGPTPMRSRTDPQALSSTMDRAPSGKTVEEVAQSVATRARHWVEFSSKFS